MTWPFFQCLCKDCMIGICTGICYDLNCLIKVDSALLKEADQLRDTIVGCVSLIWIHCIIGKS